MASVVFQLPDEAALAPLLRRFPGRDCQIRALAALLHTDAAPCRNLVIHGAEATGKSSVTRQLLAQLSESNETANGRAAGLVHATVDVARCISGRHLFESIIAAATDALRARDGSAGGDVPYQRCETLAQLAASLNSVFDEPQLKNELTHFVLVLDGMDRQRDAPPTLMPALARLCETIPCLTCVFIVTTPPAGFLRACPSSHLYFPPYTKSELIQILSLEPPPAIPTRDPETGEELQDEAADPEEVANLWAKFSAAVYDSLSQAAGRSLPAFRNSCYTLWPRFVAPIVAGTYTPQQFSKLLIAARPFFQDEGLLNPKLVSPRASGTDASNDKSRQSVTGSFSSSTASTTLTSHPSHPLSGLTSLLPTTAKILLLSSYLASHNTVRHDLGLFSTSYNGRKRRRPGPNANRANNRNKQRKIARKLLGAHAFLLERLLAIFEAVKTEWADSAGPLTGLDGDIGMALATLSSLKLLIRIGTGDIMDRSGKWRINVGWEIMRGISRSIGVSIEEWLVE
ncbi:origin recognition complex subunit 5 C-terminus domain-containing protein [Trichoderma longibrachiatum]